jgi:hypothetical protein
MATTRKHFRDDMAGNITAAVTAVLIVLGLCFYAPAVLRNFSWLVIGFGIAAIVVYALGILVNLKGMDAIVGAALTAFCFGYYLIGRLESINLLQVNLSDINIYFYVDMVLWSAALFLSVVTAVVKKVQ